MAGGCHDSRHLMDMFHHLMKMVKDFVKKNTQ